MSTFLPALSGVAYAYVNHGRWVVECPQVRPFVCRDALTLPVGSPVFECWTCGTRAEIRWPHDVAMIEELLRARPDPATRNWQPGEPVVCLLTENLAYGIGHASTPEVGAASSRLVVNAASDDVRIMLLDEPKIIDAYVPPELES